MKEKLELFKKLSKEKLEAIRLQRSQNDTKSQKATKKILELTK